MSVQISLLRRAVLLLAAPMVLIVCHELAWRLLPRVRQCGSLFCGQGFDPGGVDVFGSQIFTTPQTALVAAGIVASVTMLGRGLMPRRFRWTTIGLGVLALGLVVAVTLPSPAVAAAPSAPCSTPGPDGAIWGTCATGPAPTDPRLADRASVLGAGALALTASMAIDRRRPAA